MTITNFVRLVLVFTFLLGIFAAGNKQLHAQMQNPGIPQFMPMGSWQVEPTSFSNIRGLSNIKLPCMMMTSYDNGYIVRLSGGGGVFLAMAIDFRQSAFTQGRKYNAVFSLNNGYTNQIQATAFSESVLIINLRSFADFYNALQTASAMIIDIEGNPLEFGLGSLGEGTQRLEACFGSNMPMPTSPSVTPPPAPAPQGVAMTNDTSAWNQKVTPVPAQIPTGLRSSGAMPSSLWEAKAGDDLRQTLEAWSNRAGVAIDWQANNNGRVANDIRITGSFEDAVQNLMAQNAAAMGLEANLMGRGSMPMANTGGGMYGGGMISPQVSSAATGDPISLQSPPTMGGARWSAPAGSNLQQVLSMWSKQAGVSMLWQSDYGFTVKSPVNDNSTYESALQSLLSQFTNDSVRPAAQLNNDPVTGERLLLIESTHL